MDGDEKVFKKKTTNKIQRGTKIIIFWKVEKKIDQHLKRKRDHNLLTSGKKKGSRCKKGKRSWLFEEWEEKKDQDPKREKNHNLKVKQNENS